jgi:hypothetical protein
MAASSWAAKILRGLFLKSKTEMKLLSQILWRRFKAKSRSSSYQIKNIVHNLDLFTLVNRLAVTNLMLYRGIMTDSEMNSRNFFLISWLS